MVLTLDALDKGYDSIEPEKGLLVVSCWFLLVCSQTCRTFRTGQTHTDPAHNLENSLRRHQDDFVVVSVQGSQDCVTNCLGY